MAYKNISDLVYVQAYSVIEFQQKKNRKFRHTKHYFNYTFFLRTSKIIMRLNALIF